MSIFFSKTRNPWHLTTTQEWWKKKHTQVRYIQPLLMKPTRIISSFYRSLWFYKDFTLDDRNFFRIVRAVKRKAFRSCLRMCTSIWLYNQRWLKKAIGYSCSSTRWQSQNAIMWYRLSIFTLSTVSSAMTMPGLWGGGLLTGCILVSERIGRKPICSCCMRPIHWKLRLRESRIALGITFGRFLCKQALFICF